MDAWKPAQERCCGRREFGSGGGEKLLSSCTAGCRAGTSILPPLFGGLFTPWRATLILNSRYVQGL
jgi:hypothetical protein